MALQRRSYTPAAEIALTTQVESCCPLCGEPLFFRKGTGTYKCYELAHIYPLNPKSEEIDELKDVALLHFDRNDTDNLIPLCVECHTKFDKPRTRAEYETLYDIKSKLIERERQRALMREYPIEKDIQHIIASLGAVAINGVDELELSLDPKSVDAKFDATMPELTRRKIKHNVGDYYQHVFREFRALEQLSPTKSQLIYSQVKSFYLKQKDLGLSQKDIFHNVVEWFRNATKPETIEAPEIVAAFFVQNCEVFE
jgi:hypothetical protein